MYQTFMLIAALAMIAAAVGSGIYAAGSLRRPKRPAPETAFVPVPRSGKWWCTALAPAVFDSRKRDMTASREADKESKYTLV